MNTEQQVFENIEENILATPQEQTITTVINKYNDSKVYKLTSQQTDQIYIPPFTETPQQKRDRKKGISKIIRKRVNEVIVLGLDEAMNKW